MERISALELAMMEDLYGTTNVTEMLNSKEYKAEFDEWVRKMEEDNSLTLEEDDGLTL